MARRDDEEDWARELNRPDGYPFLAAIIGGAATAAIVWFGLPFIGPQPIVRAIAGGAAVAACVWVIGWLVTIRHASALWQWGAFLILAGTGGATAWFGNGASAERLKLDVATVVEMEVGRDGKPVFPRGALARGPVSQLYMGYYQHLEEDRRALDAAVDEMKPPRMQNASAVAADPSLLGGCDRIGQIKAKIEEIRQRQIKRLTETLAQVDALRLPERTRGNLRAAVEGAGSAATINETAALQTTMVEHGQASCVIVARRRWEPAGRIFMFTNRGDLNEMQAHARAIQEAATKLRQLELDTGTAREVARRNLASEYGL